ncbi:MAG: 2-amino-3,7-dideoxy-D-threo-hept-6-ulosonate synthase [Candidatus Micrarchaeia archaeon]
MNGKKIRLRRIMGGDGRVVMIPMDHGLSMGPEGLEDIAGIVHKVALGGADSVLVHKGNARFIKDDIGLLIMLNGSTALSIDARDRVRVGTVKEALALGADGVSLQLNMGAVGEKEMLRDFGEISRECAELGVPLLAMMYARGPNIKKEEIEKHVPICVRAGVELGADIIKVPYPGRKAFEYAVKSANGVPVVIAGGAKSENPRDVLHMVHESIQAGGSGVSLGRNVFQAKDPTKMTRAIAAIVHKGKGVEDALGELR